MLAYAVLALLDAGFFLLVNFMYVAFPNFLRLKSISKLTILVSIATVLMEVNFAYAQSSQSCEGLFQAEKKPQLIEFANEFVTRGSTYLWVNLHEIPDLEPYLSPVGDLGSLPLTDSPFALLPAEIRKEIQKRKGLKVAPQLVDPVSALIREELVQHYAALRGRPLTSTEVVEVLERHIGVERPDALKKLD